MTARWNEWQQRYATAQIELHGSNVRERTFALGTNTERNEEERTIRLIEMVPLSEP